MFDALAVGGEGATAVEPIDSAVESLVCSAQVCGHEVGVVEVGKRGFGIVGASGEDGVGVGREALEAFWTDGRQREGVVNYADRVHIVTF